MPKTHSNDIIVVRNIDVNCDDVTTDIIPGYHKEVDEDTGAEYSRYDYLPWELKHSEEFAVRWANVKHSIKPGETRLLPRFLAEHYAKHLADHILAKRERVEGRVGLVNNAIERPKVLEQILVRIAQYFEDPGTTDEGMEALKQVEDLNRGVNLGTGNLGDGSKGRELGELDAGQVPDKAVGTLVDKPAQTEEEALSAAGEGSIGSDPGEVVETSVNEAALPPRADLVKEAFKLGIDVKPRDTARDIAQKIKAF